MQRTSVRSSTIRSIGYDASHQLLEVEFLSGSIYQYQGVPPSIHSAFMTAPSHGSYFTEHVRNGGYQYTKVN